MLKRNLSLALVILIIGSMLGGCGKAEEDTFVVGMEAGYAPFNWTQLDDEGGAVKIDGSSEYAGGYDVEIAKRIAEGLGKELVIKKVEWDGLLPALNSGTIDAVIAGMSPTEERKKSIDFTDTYYTSDLVMIVKKGSKYENAKKISDFEGAKITGQLNTFHYEVVDQIPGVEKQTAMADFPAMRVALESGIIDGYISERPEGLSVKEANPDFVMVEFEDEFKASEEDRSISVGVKKGSELTEEINKIIAEIDKSEQEKIMEEVVEKQPVNN